MSIIINEYKDNIDKCWYNSSNVKYSECNDIESGLKEVKVVFKDGRTYIYKGIPVQQYLMFRNSASQGSALFKYIAVKNKYETEKLENSDLSLIESEKLMIIEEREKESKLINQDSLNEENEK